MAVKKVLMTGAAGYVAGQLLPTFRQRYDTLLIDASTLYPESTEGGRRVSVLKRQEGAPVNLG